MLTNLPFPRYIFKEYNGDEVTGSFFKDELIGYKHSDLYPIEVKKKRKSNDGLEYLVHYVGWPHGNLKGILIYDCDLYMSDFIVCCILLK